MDIPLDDRLELALQASHEGIWQWDLSSNQISYSDRILNMIGHTNETAPHLFENLLQHYHPEDATILSNELKKLLSGEEEVLGVHCRFIHPDGSYRWLRIRGCVALDKDGSPYKAVGSIIDITRRKHAEQVLEEERHLLKALVESIPANIYFKDKESKFVKANTATAEKMGFTHVDEIIGKSDHDFFDPVHADKSRADEVNIMEQQEQQTSSLEKETWEGQENSWVITSKMPWLDSKGKVKGTFGVTNDVTELVQTQQRLVEVAEKITERNQQFEEELSLATELQQASLVTDIPSLPHSGDTLDYTASFASTHIPMTGLAGDFYEIISISDSKMGILICDVMGHGVRAALVVSMIRGLIDKELEEAESPENFIFGLNEGLTKILSKTNITMFATALYIVIDVENGTIQFCSAGHPLPIIKKANSYQQFTNPKLQKGTALGLVKETIYGSSTLSLADVDECILFTDGIFEVTDAEDEELGVEGMLEKLNQAPIGNEFSTDHMISLAQQYADSTEFGDDVCLLSILAKKS